MPIRLNDIEDEIETRDLKLNHKKTRVMRPHKRQVVTGVVVNEKLGVPKYKWRKLRARLHNYIRDNKVIFEEEYISIRGYVEWIRQLHPVLSDQ